jgi:hypothetical protein
MRIFHPPDLAAVISARARRGSRSGFTVLVVLALLLIMASFAIGNNIALHHLQRELRLIERRQQNRLATTNQMNGPAEAATLPPGARVNTPPASPVGSRSK